MPEYYRGAPTLVTDEHGRERCVACQLCEFICPPRCIRIKPGEIPAESVFAKVEKYPDEFDIDMARCIFCGLCEEVCPEQAIFLRKDYAITGTSREEMIHEKSSCTSWAASCPSSSISGTRRSNAAMPSLLFWTFASLMLIFAGAVVLNRNPVASALSLVVSFLCLAALFVGLDAFLIAVLQVLVYAGAVMVLFLFIIMLLDLKAEERRKFNLLSVAGGGAVALGFVVAALAGAAALSRGRAAFPGAGAKGR